MPMIFKIAAKYGKDPDEILEWHLDKVYTDVLIDFEAGEYQKDLKKIMDEAKPVT